MSIGKGILKQWQHLKPKPILGRDGRWVLLQNCRTASGSMTAQPSHRVPRAYRGAVGVLSDTAVRWHKNSTDWNDVWRNTILPQANEVFWFTFVRNPWDRIVSALHHLQQTRDKCVGLGLQSFVKAIATQGWRHFGLVTYRHVAPQLPKFCFQGVRISEVFIGRYESIEADWANVAAILKVPNKLPHVRKSKHRHYSEYYDEETKDLVRKLYKEEIDMLGYKFE